MFRDWLPRFHVRLSVAPLKLFGEGGKVKPRLLFPRSAERGPIEATFHVARSGHGFAFPRSAERGPIEAP